MITDYKKELFIGTIDTKEWRQCYKDFFSLAKDIRNRLQKKAYLLDSYLNCLLGALPNTASLSTENTIAEGFSYASCLLRYCTKAMNGEQAEENSMYQHVKDFIDAHPLPFQERMTRRSFYFAVLIHDYCDLIIEEYRQELIYDLMRSYDSCEARELHRDICTLLGGEEKMETLKSLFEKHFLLAAPLRIFTQCLNENLLFSLTHRDRETSKQIFQLLLESDFPNDAALESLP